MKVNIKGLVFTGFAAAILSANAMAANPASDLNTVTSKSYVDAEVAKKQTKSTAASIGGENGGWTPLDTQITDNGASAPVTSAIKAYVDNAVQGTGSVYQAISSAVDIYAVADGQGGWTALESDLTANNLNTANGATAGAIKEYVADEIESALNTGITGSGYVTDSYSEGVTTVALDATKITDSSALTNASTKLVREGDVKAYIDAADSALDSRIDALEAADTQPYTAGTGIEVDDHTINNLGVLGVSATDANGANGTVTVTTYDTQTNTTVDTTIAVKGLQGAAYLPTETTISSTAADNTNSEVATAKAVYDYVQSQTGGTIIPARNASVCTDSTPCALVYEADGAHWRTMATATDSGGVLGDAQ